jgi:hypothetical protein
MIDGGGSLLEEVSKHLLAPIIRKLKESAAEVLVRADQVSDEIPKAYLTGFAHGLAAVGSSIQKTKADLFDR